MGEPASRRPRTEAGRTDAAPGEVLRGQRPWECPGTAGRSRDADGEGLLSGGPALADVPRMGNVRLVGLHLAAGIREFIATNATSATPSEVRGIRWKAEPPG
ncbi:hypothetical protein GCM10022233_77520 [Streptomyces shaanxiensis]|uniref:Uncharacterized protein n=1 Tax=Streptomyces shaanxiensis TaxID=653357 RepID=A0ABP7WAR0_9ACTN